MFRDIGGNEFKNSPQSNFWSTFQCKRWGELNSAQETAETFEKSNGSSCSSRGATETCKPIEKRRLLSFFLSKSHTNLTNATKFLCYLCCCGNGKIFSPFSTSNSTVWSRRDFEFKIRLHSSKFHGVHWGKGNYLINGWTLLINRNRR